MAANIGKTSSGKNVPAALDPLYRNAFKLPKYNIKTVDVFVAHGNDGAKILRYLFPEWVMEDHLEAATLYETEAGKADEEWGKIAEKAHGKAFGTKRQVWDYKVSGIGRDEYDEKSKEKLRELAQDASSSKSLAHLHRQASRMVNRIKNFKTPVDAKVSAQDPNVGYLARLSGTKADALTKFLEDTGFVPSTLVNLVSKKSLNPKTLEKAMTGIDKKRAVNEIKTAMLKKLAKGSKDDLTTDVENPKYAADFKAGFTSGTAEVAKNPNTDSTVGKLLYSGVSKKHGITWLAGFNAAVDLSRGATNTGPASVARKLGLHAAARESFRDIITAQYQVVSGPGAGVTVRIDNCDVNWTKKDDTITFESASGDVSFSSYYDTKNSSDYGEEGLTVELDALSGDDANEFLHRFGSSDDVEGTLHITKKHKICESGHYHRDLTLSGGYTRSTMKKGDTFDFMVAIDSDYQIALKGTATLGIDAADAWQGLDSNDEEGED